MSNFKQLLCVQTVFMAQNFNELEGKAFAGRTFDTMPEITIVNFHVVGIQHGIQCLH